MTLEDFLEQLYLLFPAEMLTRVENKIVLTVPWNDLVADNMLPANIKLAGYLAERAIDAEVLTTIVSFAHKPDQSMVVEFHLRIKSEVR